MTRHELMANPQTTINHYDPTHAPVLTVRPGDTVVVDSLDAAGFLERPAHPGHKPQQRFTDRPGHCLTGPIAVEGAEPGDVLAVRLVDLTPGAWGWTQAGGLHTPINDRLAVADLDPTFLLWELDAAAGVGRESRGLERTLAPFLGVTGVAPAAPGQHSTIPPRTGLGGNIDCRDLVAGSTLYLPVEVAGALLYLGDGHAAQGDGEVSGTAIECPMTTEVVLDLVTDPVVRSVHAEAPVGTITFGFSTDLTAAAGDALDAMVDVVAARFDLDRPTALAYASVAVDLRVTQVVNQTWGVHAVLPPDVLRRM